MDELYEQVIVILSMLKESAVLEYQKWGLDVGIKAVKTIKDARMIMPIEPYETKEDIS